MPNLQEMPEIKTQSNQDEQILRSLTGWKGEGLSQLGETIRNFPGFSKEAKFGVVGNPDRPLVHGYNPDQLADLLKRWEAEGEKESFSFTHPHAEFAALEAVHQMIGPQDKLVEQAFEKRLAELRDSLANQYTGIRGWEEKVLPQRSRRPEKASTVGGSAALDAIKNTLSEIGEVVSAVGKRPKILIPLLAVACSGGVGIGTGTIPTPTEGPPGIVEPVEPIEYPSPYAELPPYADITEASIEKALSRVVGKLEFPDGSVFWDRGKAGLADDNILYSETTFTLSRTKDNLEMGKAKLVFLPFALNPQLSHMVYVINNEVYVSRLHPTDPNTGILVDYQGKELGSISVNLRVKADGSEEEVFRLVVHRQVPIPGEEPGFMNEEIVLRGRLNPEDWNQYKDAFVAQSTFLTPTPLPLPTETPTPIVEEHDLRPAYTETISSEFMSIPVTGELITNGDLDPSIKKVFVDQKDFAEFLINLTYKFWEKIHPGQSLETYAQMIAEVRAGERNPMDIAFSFYAGDFLDGISYLNSDRSLNLSAQKKYWIIPFYEGDVPVSPDGTEVRAVSEINIALVKGRKNKNVTIINQAYHDGFGTHLDGNELIFYVGFWDGASADDKNSELNVARHIARLVWWGLNNIGKPFSRDQSPSALQSMVDILLRSISVK